MLQKLAQMCDDPNFDETEALKLMKQVDIAQEFETTGGRPWFTYTTTLMAEAIDSCNIRMLRLLLENGLDPNLTYDEGDSPFYDLQFGAIDDENAEIRLQMAQLLLEYGANPNIDPENCGEDLFQYVLSAVFDDDPLDIWKYRSRFFILLVAYQGKTDYCIPRIIREFDKSNMAQYEFFLVPEKDGYYSGIIYDSEDNIIAYI